MSISRKLPKSSIGIESALKAAKAMLAFADPSLVPYTPNTLDKIVPVCDAFTQLMQDARLALYRQVYVGNATSEALTKARMYISHFFQAFNNGIERGIYDVESRLLYGLSLNSGRVPYLGSEAEVIRWGDNIIKGDAFRIAAGGAPMSNPTAAEVEYRVLIYEDKVTQYGLRKTAYSTALFAIANAQVGADALVRQMWSETETFNNHLKFPARRAMCRPWGVIYTTDQVMIITVLVIDKTNGDAIVNAMVHCLEGDTSQRSDKAGNSVIKTSVENEVTIMVDALGFVSQQLPVIFETGVAAYTLKFMMLPDEQLIIENNNLIPNTDVSI